MVWFYILCFLTRQRWLEPSKPIRKQLKGERDLLVSVEHGVLVYHGPFLFSYHPCARNNWDLDSSGPSDVSKPTSPCLTSE